MKLSWKNQLSVFLRRYFLAGLLVWIPIWVTFIVIKFILEILDQTISLLPEHYRVPGLGVIITLLIILATGMVAANYLGKQLVEMWDSFIEHIPLIRSIHTGVKKVLQTVITPGGHAFRKVLLVEFPHADVWTIAFQTSEETPQFEKLLGSSSLITVFVPTTPNITSGFIMLFSKENVVEVNMSVDEALRYVISLGVVQPEEKK